MVVDLLLAWFILLYKAANLVVWSIPCWVAAEEELTDLQMGLFPQHVVVAALTLSSVC